MIRKALKKQESGIMDHFRLRGLENTRIESLSDAVFAIAIGLLLISSEIPETYDELAIFMADFIPFAATIALLIMVWYQHYLFFIRYGLRDSFTVFLNTTLLFLVLFYVYPLKFLFKVLFVLFSGLITRDYDRLEELFTVTIRREDTSDLMFIYGLGAVAIFVVISLLYYTAWRKREALDLDEIELFDTRTSIRQNLLMALVPLLSSLVAIFEIGGSRSFTIAGMTYWLYAIIMPWFGVKIDRKRKKVLERIDQQN